MVAQVLPGITQLVPNAANTLFEDYPKRAKYLGATFDDRGLPVPVVGKTPLVKAVASRMTGYLSKFDIKDFDKNPELLGLTTARLPITPLILMFYAAMIPGRMDQARQRAEVKSDGTKDYREVRDVVIRDVLSIALFLFGLEILNAKMLEGVQQKGRVAPSAIFPSSSAKLQVLGGQPEFWSRWPQLSVDDKVKKLKGDEHSAISHPTLRKQYYLANDGVLSKIVSNPINREGLLPLFDQQRNALSAFSDRPPFNKAMEAMGNGLRVLVNSAQDMDETIKSALQLGSPEAKAHYWRALDPVREQLFSLPALTGHEAVAGLTLPQLRQAMAQRVDAAHGPLQATLAKLEPQGNGKTGNEALSALLKAARSGQGQELTDELQHWALNNGERLNRHLTEQLGLVKGSKPFRKQFDHYWNTLHELQIQAPVYHSRRHAQELLAQPETGNRLLEGIQTVFRHSHEAMEQIAHLEAVSKAENVTTSRLGPFGKSLFEPRKFLANAAIRLRTPADWLSLVFIVAALGYFPVWFNETLTNYLFDRGEGKDKHQSARDPLNTQHHHSAHKLERTEALSTGFALSPAAAPAKTLTPINSLPPMTSLDVAWQPHGVIPLADQSQGALGFPFSPTKASAAIKAIAPTALMVPPNLTPTQPAVRSALGLPHPAGMNPFQVGLTQSVIDNQPQPVS